MKTGSFLPSDNPRIPRADHPYFHCLKLQTRFTDCDMLGHVNNNTFLSYMDLGKARYFETALGPLFDFNNIAVAIVNINVDFYEQAFFVEPLEVWTRVTAIGNKSIHFEQRVVNSSTGHTKCMASTAMTAFDPATAKSIPLDQAWVAAVELYEERSLRKKTDLPPSGDTK